FENMSRQQLIARLMELEQEKRAASSSQSSPNMSKSDLQKLISHIAEKHVGSGKATYSCEWEGCPRNQKPFTKRHKMYNHLRTHTGERPFVCPKPDCEKRFSRPDSLTTHIKTHSNVRPYICSSRGCNKAYYHSRSLKKHEKIHEM
ncbi:uncharacterized protein BYT42DRAFT_485872, partial [Radiomyces spectabilis]|uniref:uncharacterized protein n=1 Tax=Radiomyces spectabilis TaxID=64574 RepID=UPI00221F9084